MSTLQTISLRNRAIYIPLSARNGESGQLKSTTSVLIANLGKLGFSVDEPLLQALNQTSPKFQLNLLEQFRTVMGIKKNWTPLVKAWDEPTGETLTDHIMTFFANVFQARGTRLACGHIIPANTFPLERYNGCPFCGTPFEFGKIEYKGQGSKMKLLSLWEEKDINAFFQDLLTSKTALDATQLDSLTLLLAELPLPKVKIGMKETLMAVIDVLVEHDKADQAQALFQSPADILRYLWFKHTGFLQIIRPKTIINRTRKNAKAIYFPIDTKKIKGDMKDAATNAKEVLKLKYSRKECARVANWLNNLDMPVAQMCEIMHPKRSMWVRFIRALRLAEYAKRGGFEKLKSLLDAFYNKDYTVWQGRVNHFRLKSDAANTLGLLKQRPGLFARSLFANMLWFGKDDVSAAFAEVVDQVPARLLFTLDMYAGLYFNPEGNRTVKPLGGTSKNIPNNPLLALYEPEDLKGMTDEVTELCLLAMKKRFAAIETANKSIYIDPILYKMPVSIGDRNETVQDLPSALMGTRFELEGETVRLFMQWGVGLKAQRLDMDLSCLVAYEDHTERCSYNQLTIKGCQHSGDILEIPNKVGTAEYIDINVKSLSQAGAKYVTFTCNAYSNGSLSPNLVVGWMDSKYPMKISKRTGVAYDPSCVQHQARITRGLTKGLVFGVLDVAAREIIWLEMPFGGQVVQNMNWQAVAALIEKLDSKLSIGNLLDLKAEAQGLALVETVDADEVYDQKWAANAAAVTQLLVD